MDPARNVVRRGSSEASEQAVVSEAPFGDEQVVCEIVEETYDNGTADGRDGGG